MTSIAFENATTMTIGGSEYLLIPLAAMEDKIKGRKFASESSGKYTAELKKYRRARSLSANSYAWLLITKLSEVLKINPVDIYRGYVEEVGKFSQYLMTESAYKDFKRVWEYDHIGRFSRIMGESREKQGYLWVAAYHGSSDFTTDEMGRMIENIVQDCELQGIEAKTPKEIAELMEKWQ